MCYSTKVKNKKAMILEKELENFYDLLSNFVGRKIDDAVVCCGSCDDNCMCMCDCAIP